MLISDLFVVASREKYRYPYKGYISTEDLWDLTPQALDSIYKELNAQLKKMTGEESLLAARSVDDAVVTLQNRIQIVKDITLIKLDEIEKRKEASANAAKRQKIMDILADKENQALKDMSADDLRKMLEGLQ